MENGMITKNALSLARVSEERKRPLSIGATIWFEGVVRNHNEGKKVSGIFYEAHASMAEKELENILKEVKKKWTVTQVSVYHRVGELKAGDVSLLVRVDAPHRKECFAAGEYVIDEIKKRVPIWKKEKYEKREEGEKWIGV